MASPRVLEIDGLVTRFRTQDGEGRAVDGVTLRVERGETVALVGESGCGKYVTALSILRLVPSRPGASSPAGSCFEGRDLLPLGRKRSGCAATRSHDLPGADDLA